MPQAEGGDNSLENAAPLCALCHDLYGGNPEKRKALRQMRDYWWSHMQARWTRIIQAVGVDDSVCIPVDLHSAGSLHTQSVAIYHLVLPEEDFHTSAQHILSLVRAAQDTSPNRRRCLYLDIEGHRNLQGGFDADMYELQRGFILGFMSRWLSEMHLPLIGVRRDQVQANDIPGILEIIEKVDQDFINKAIDAGTDLVWIADRDKYIRFE